MKKPCIIKVLRRQGVSSPEILRGHLSFLSETLRVNPTYDVLSYRVSKGDTPQPYMG